MHEGTNGMNPVKAVLISFYYCLDYCMDQWSGWPVAILLIILIPLFWKALGNTTFRFPCPLIVVGFGYCLVSAMMTPPLFAVGNMEAARLQALTYTMYILILTLCEGYVVGYVRQRLYSKGKEEGKDFSPAQAWWVTGCILFFATASVLTVIPDPDYFVMSSATTDLANGSAQAYGNALGERMKLYESGEKNIEVDPLPTRPALLYFADIEQNSEDWKNRGICRFYGLESVTLLP